MKIKIYGCRGSIPVEGKSYMKYGGDTTCIECIDTQGNICLIDAGSGIRKAGNDHQQQHHHSVTLLFTHYHWDHIIGLPFYKPMYNSNVNVDIYGPDFDGKDVRKVISEVMTPPYFPINTSDMRAEINYHDINISDGFTCYNFSISTIPIHHPNGGVGYRFEEQGKSFVFLTDNELTDEYYDQYVTFASGADCLIHDAEFTAKEYERREGWGHSEMNRVVRLSSDAGVKSLGLFHHNQDRDDNSLKDIENHLKQKTDINVFAAYAGQIISL